MKTEIKNYWICFFPILIFAIFGLKDLMLPGIYMDAANPDYHAAYMMRGGRSCACVDVSRQLSFQEFSPFKFLVRREFHCLSRHGFFFRFGVWNTAVQDVSRPYRNCAFGLSDVVLA
ncbi:hypothetical protein [Achromobacter ruhlandii]|uniref:hypothetical protein n=1 Tax=Achromobacter ruhlandii TaxID=72557 RepID=UPI0012E76E79|nr:hypothetical protein [Achromobacter ruhlandii]